MTGVGSEHVIADADTLAPLFVERRQFPLGCLGCDVVLQAADHPQGVSGAIPAVGRVQSQRQPDLWPDIQDVGARRHDADHFARPAVHFHRFPDHRLSAKRGLPQLVRENSDRWQLLSRRRVTEPVGFSAGEQPSLGRLQAERVEQILVDVRVTHAPSSAGGSQIHLARARRKRPHLGK